MLREFNKLLALIDMMYPSLTVEMEEFPSGSILLDVDVAFVTVELEFRKHKGLGVSIIDTTTNPFGLGHDYAFGDFEEAKEAFLLLIKSLVESKAE